MPKHSFAPILGKINRFVLDSKLLENRLGDPTSREIIVHNTPEGIDLIEKGGQLPAIIYLAPFTSSGPARAGWKAFSESILQRHERLVKVGEMEPCLLVLPDTFTSLGGNQFVDSPVMGNWSSWLSSELKKRVSLLLSRLISSAKRIFDLGIFKYSSDNKLKIEFNSSFS